MWIFTWDEEPKKTLFQGSRAFWLSWWNNRWNLGCVWIYVGSKTMWYFINRLDVHHNSLHKMPPTLVSSATFECFSCSRETCPWWICKCQTKEAFSVWMPGWPSRSNWKRRQVEGQETRPTAISYVLLEQYLMKFTKKNQKCTEISEMYGSLRNEQKYQKC